MAFFEPVPEEQLSAELRRLIEIARKRTPTHTVHPNILAMAAHPRVLKGFVEVREELNPIPSRFGAESTSPACSSPTASDAAPASI